MASMQSRSMVSVITDACISRISLHLFIFYCIVSGIFVQGWMKEFAGRGYINSRKKCRWSGDTLRFLCPPVRLWMTVLANSLRSDSEFFRHNANSRKLSIATPPVDVSENKYFPALYKWTRGRGKTERCWRWGKDAMYGCAGIEDYRIW